MSLLLAIILHLTISYILHIPIYWAGSLIIALCYFLPKHRMHILLGASVLWALIPDNNLYSIILFGKVISNPIPYSQDIRNIYSPYLNNLGGLIGFLLFSFVLFKIYKKLFSKFSMMSSFFVILSVFGFSLLMNVFWSNYYSYFSYVAFCSGLIASKQLWYLMLMCRDLPFQSKKRISSFGNLLLPFWTRTTEARELFDLSAYQKTKKSEMHICFNQGFKNLAFVFCFFVLVKLIKILTISFFVKKELIYPLYEEQFFEIVISELAHPKQLNFIQSWILILGYGTSHFFEAFFVYGQYIAATAQLCGIGMTNYVDKPWISKSFADFFSRSMYYYNYIIMNFFFYPAIQFSRKFVINKNARIFVFLNFAIVVGGYVFHLFFVRHMAFEKNIPNMFTNSFNILPYLLALSLAVSASVLFSKNRKFIFFQNLPNVLRFSIYLGVYCLIFVLTLLYKMEWKNFGILYLKLMGINYDA